MRKKEKNNAHVRDLILRIVGVVEIYQRLTQNKTDVINGKNESNQARLSVITHKLRSLRLQVNSKAISSNHSKSFGPRILKNNNEPSRKFERKETTCYLRELGRIFD